jgi:citrate synthase
MEMSEPQGPRPATSISTVAEDRIRVRGMDLVDELMGRVTFTQMIFLMIAGRLPGEREEQLLDACLVSLVDHGLTLSAMVARAHYSTAPEAIQGAVAAGLLGVGSRIAGSMEGCGEVLDRLAREVDAGRDARSAARDLVAEHRSQGRPIPGLGHLTHTGGDPRALRLIGLAKERGMGGRYVPLLEVVAEEVQRQAGKAVPINVTGAIAAVLLEMGFEWWLLRGFALISRCPGLVAHIREERQSPVTPALRQFLAEGGA